MSKSHNLVCHWCRRSKNRPRAKKVEYFPCSKCRMVYCYTCVKLYPNIKPFIAGCLHCRGLCCCIRKCDKNHRCCFNSRRNLKRNVRIAIPIEIIQAEVIL
jgi:hypothetical protein